MAQVAQVERSSHCLRLVVRSRVPPSLYVEMCFGKTMNPTVLLVVKLTWELLSSVGDREPVKN